MFPLPTEKDVACSLRALNSSATGRTTVYLQIFDDGKWWVHDQNASIDTQEYTYTSKNEVPGCIGSHHKPRKFNAEQVAKELLDEVRESYKEHKSQKNAHV